MTLSIKLNVLLLRSDTDWASVTTGAELRGGSHPCRDVTGLWQAGGAGRKDGGSWGAAIRRGKGKIPIYSQVKRPAGDLSALILSCVWFLCCRWRLAVTGGWEMWRKSPGLKHQPPLLLLLLLLLLFLAQLPLICEPQTEAPCTVLVQNRNRVHIINSPEHTSHTPFSLRVLVCVCFLLPCLWILVLWKFSYTKNR